MQFQSLRGQLIQLLIEQQKIDQLRAIAVKRDRKYQELSDIIEIEINAGRSVIFRLAEVEVERAEVSRKLSELDGAEAEIEAQLINLVGFTPKVKAPDLSLQPWSGNALAFYAVRVADAGVNIMDAAVQQAEADFKPDWGVNLTYQQRESGRGAPRSNFDGDDWVSGGVSFTIPFWADKKQEPNLRAAKNDRESARYNRMDVARRVLSQWKRFDARRTVAAENIKIFDTKIGAIDSRIASQLITYETGAGDYSPIIDGEIAILKLREQIVTERALRDQAIAHMNSLLVGASS
jgi:outer membrane protein TolC